MHRVQWSLHDWSTPLHTYTAVMHGSDLLYVAAPASMFSVPEIQSLEADIEYVWRDEKAVQQGLKDAAIIGGRIIARKLARCSSPVKQIDLLIKFCGAREFPLVNFHQDEGKPHWSFGVLPPIDLILAHTGSASTIFSFSRCYSRLTLLKQYLIHVQAQPKKSIYGLYSLLLNESESWRYLIQCQKHSSIEDIEHREQVSTFCKDVLLFDTLFWRLIDLLEEWNGKQLLSKL